MTGARVVAGPVVGFRAWTTRGDGELRPTGFSEGASWYPGVTVAACGSGHRAPAHDCRCGLYALHDWWRLGPGSRRVFGAVVAWGRVEVHETGFRAEFASPVVFASHRSQPASEVAMVRRAGVAFGVPVVDLSDLEPFAQEFGARCDAL